MLQSIARRDFAVAYIQLYYSRVFFTSLRVKEKEENDIVGSFIVSKIWISNYVILRAEKSKSDSPGFPLKAAVQSYIGKW